MNSNRRVLVFVLTATGILFFISIFGTFAGLEWTPFQRISLVSDIVSEKPPAQLVSLPEKEVPVERVAGKASFDLKKYKQAVTITNFSTDSTEVTVKKFIAKLRDLKSGKPTKIRIAYFGDSMIEGDLLSQTLRKLLQAEFGGKGVGFVPVNSPVSQFRQTVYTKCSGAWEDETFKDKNAAVYLSGQVFRTGSGSVQLSDQTIGEQGTEIEKSLICGYAPKPISITVNSGAFTVRATDRINRIPINNDPGNAVGIAISDASLPVYGISFESAAGVFVDNFSFRGITGIEFARVDSVLMAAVARNNPYDLIIFQYGVNLLFRPNEKNFSWYARSMKPVIRKIRNCFPESDFILVSTADRAFRYGSEYRSAVGIDSLVQTQALLALESGSAFYNQFASMGGTNSIVAWAKQSPSLANKDYVHPNHRGAEVLGKYFFEAIMQQYNKSLRHPR